MREGAPDEVLSGVASWRPVVSSWLGGVHLGDVPVQSGRLTASVDQQVPERLTLTVLRFDGRDWLPGDDPEHPLARFGQELTVSIVTGSAVTGVEYETRVGRFMVQEWSFDDLSGVVSVTAVGLLQRVADHRINTPTGPRPGGSLASEFRRLLPNRLVVGVDPALTDRACPRSMEWAEDRLGALYEIADAWPARLRTDQWGQLALLPPLPEGITAPVVSLRDGHRGTVVGVARSDTRDQVYNRVVARATVTDDASKPPIQSVASQASGPMAVGGPYGIVTRFWASPLITNRRQAVAAAQTMLANSLRSSRTVPVTIAPDPRIDLDDPVEVIRDGDRVWGWVVAYDLPLTVADGAMRIDVGLGV